jgi:hypothetical protein
MREAMTKRISRFWMLVTPAAGLFLAAAATRTDVRSGRAVFARDTITRTYDVQLAFTGYTGLAESPDCRRLTDAQGYDSLIGTVSGIETPDEPGEDVVYTGTLRRKTKIDYCQTRDAPTADQVDWCVAKLTGAARMEVEVTVYGEDGQGAYIKAEPAEPRPESATVVGSCSQADKDEIEADYPSGGSAGSPDGQAVAESRPPRFIVNRIARLRPGYFPPDTLPLGWGLRVIRGTP